MFATVIAILAGALALTGCGFYFIPKYAMGTTNGWITAIDGSISWIGANWVIFIILVVLFIIALVHTIGLFKKR